jgi:hypothetical protein
MSALARASRPREDPEPEAPPKNGVPFTEDFQFVDSSKITFSSESLQAWIDKVAQENFPFWADRSTEQHYTEPWGAYELKYRFAWREMPCYELSRFGGFLSLMSARWNRTCLHCGRGKWWEADGPVWMPVITETRFGDTEVVMSLSPMEVRTLRGSHKKCRGKVLVGGLGLGYSAAVVAARKNVTKVVVVERSKYLCDTIGKHLHETSKGKIEIVHSDVWKYLGLERNTRDKEPTVLTRDYDTLFIDIWNGYGGNKDYWEFKQLAKACQEQGRRALAWG